MMRIWNKYLMLLMSVLITACSGSDDGGAVTPPTPDISEMAISFTTDMNEMRTATKGAVNNLEALKALPEGFGVFAYLTESTLWAAAKSETATKPDFMYNQPVRWLTSDWTYSPLKYWPNKTDNAARYVSFFAYAPFIEQSDYETSGIIGMTDAGDLSPHIIYQLGDAGSQVDLLYASAADMTRNGSGLFEESGYQKVPFTFHHALACMDVYICRVYDEVTKTGNKPAVEKQAKLFVAKLTLTGKGDDTFPVKGKLSLEDGTWSATDVVANTKASLDFGEPVTGGKYGVNAFNEQLSGTASSDADYIRVRELDKWEKDGYGVDEQERLLTDKALPLMFFPQEITFTPSIQYSMIVQDNELALSTLTDSKDNKYSRVVNTITGNDVTINFEKGKRYKLLVTLGVETVQFEVVSVVDWDFPMRFNPSVDSFTEDGFTSIMVNE